MRHRLRELAAQRANTRPNDLSRQFAYDRLLARVFYPVADHIADKLCAMLETHPRATGERVGSTRYRDLVDLATFARSSEVDGDALAIALRSESARRGLTLPQRLPNPPGPDWRAGYARSARDAPGLPDRDLDAALRTVRSLLGPLLAGERVGHWNPASLSWAM